MRNITFVCLFILLFQSAHAVEPFIITDIIVKGIERLDIGTVFNHLPLKVGDELNDEEAVISIKELFRTGFFKNVTLDHDGTSLVVSVLERPTISNILIEGNRKLDTVTINTQLKQAGLSDGKIFNIFAFNRVKKEIKNMYLSLGRYSSTVNSNIINLNDNQVSIKISIKEGTVSKINKINIIGAKSISKTKIKETMRLKDKRQFSLFSKKNQYSKKKLEADIERIRSLYLDHGFYDFTITSINVEISPNKKNIFISITLDEGNVYTFAESTIEGISNDEILDIEKLISIKPDSIFSRKIVVLSRTKITEKYINEGYAFVEVRTVFIKNEKEHTITPVFTILPNRRVYVRRINITGNMHTKDQVIRRELRQFEGAWYSASSIHRSKERLQRLGLFEPVKINIVPVQQIRDQIDLNVVIKERNTGSAQLSVGYSDSDGPLVGAVYQQRNLLGTGKELSINMNTSDSGKHASISYTNPYHTIEGMSRTIKVISKKFNAEKASTAGYILNTESAALAYRIPIAETNYLNFGLTYEQIDLQATTGTPSEILSAIEKKSHGDHAVITLGVSKTTRDDFFFPTKGGRREVSLELSMPSSNFEYYKINVQSSYYIPINKFMTIRGSGELGYGNTYGKEKKLGFPFFKNYFAGGENSVRGYKTRSLGPKDKTTMEKALGGNKTILVSVELLFPPYGNSDSKDKRISLFIDSGMVYGNKEDFKLSKLKSSIGIVYNWLSPIGPFSISYGVPIKKEAIDKKEALQITFGTMFR